MASADTSSTVETRTTSLDIGKSAGRYLLAIHWLSQAGDDRIAMGELTESLAVSGASVSEMVAVLDDRGLVEYEKYEGVKLSSRGRDVATRIAWRFCVVTNFFNAILDTDIDDKTSYEISAALPEEGVFRLRQLVDHPCIEECPETKQPEAGFHQ